MKTMIIRISLIFLSLMVIATMAVNSYVFIVSYKLSVTHGLFDKLEVIQKYNVFQNLGMCTWAMLISFILLGLMLTMVLRSFLIKKNVYYLKETQEIV